MQKSVMPGKVAAHSPKEGTGKGVFAVAVTVLLAGGAVGAFFLLNRGGQSGQATGPSKEVVQARPSEQVAPLSSQPTSKSVVDQPTITDKKEPDPEPKKEGKNEPEAVAKEEPEPKAGEKPEAEPKLEGPKDPRTPVPDPAAQEKAEKLIKGLFKDEYTKKKPPEMVALASKLLEQAKETKDDPAARFVLLREARDLAAQAGETTLAIQVVAQMSKEYALPGPATKAAALEKLGQTVTTAAGGKALVDAALAAVNEALAVDDFDSADRLLKVANAAAPKTKSVPVVTSVNGRSEEVGALRKEYDRAKQAVAVLNKDPKNAEANTVVGSYYAFMKGDWEGGLPLLAAGKDQKLKGLAEKDFAAPAQPNSRMEVGDGWWDLAEESKGEAKLNIQRRACHWYEKALPELAGLNKTKVEKRVAEIAALAPHLDKWMFVSLDKLANVTSTRQSVHSKFTGNLDIEKYGQLTFEGVPFFVIDPKGGKVKNVFVFGSENGDLSAKYAKSITLPCGSKAAAIHLLGCVSYWSYLTEKPKAVIVKLKYADGTTEEVPFSAGVHFGGVGASEPDVPGSKRVYSKEGGIQMRYLSFKPAKNVAIKEIELAKTELTGSIMKGSPVIFGITIEKPVDQETKK